MAEKHKSKYKAPKDLEKSLKPKPRKDLKDYTHDDKKGALNPKSTGEKQSNVLRKTDKAMVDNGKYDVKYNADDRLYKDLEDGEYDPKHAAKVFKKRQDTDEKDNEKNIQDKIENLTREGKERLVREYVRRKIQSILREAEETPAEEMPAEEMPTDVPTDTAAAPTAPTTPETPPADVTATEPTAAPATAPAPAPAPTDTTTPAPEVAPAPTTAAPTAEPVAAKVDYNVAGTQIAGEKNTIFRVDAIGNIINGVLSKLETDKQKQSFLRMLRMSVIKKYEELNQKRNNHQKNN